MPEPVYNSINEFPGDGVTTQYEFNFSGGYISRDHVRAYTTDALGVITEVVMDPGMFVNDNTLDLGVAAPVGGITRIYRDTPRDAPLVNFQTGARITEANLDLLARQTVLGVAEAFDAGAYAAANDLLGAAGAALAAAQLAETNAAASEAAAGISAVAASASRIAAEAAEIAAEAARDDPAVQAVYTNIAAIQTCATNIAAIIAAPAAAASAEASAAAAATFDPALYVPRAGGVTLTGHVNGVAGAAGAQLVRADETVRVLSGAAKLPKWTTAGRPATPEDADFGFNTDIDCVEVWKAAYSAWVPTGWQRAAGVAGAGSAIELTGIPPWAKRVRLAVLDGSGTAAGVWIFRAGTSAGVVSAGYAGYSITFTSTTISATNNSTDWRAITIVAAGTYQGHLELSLVDEATNTWEGFGSLSRSDSNTGGLFNSRVALPGRLDRIEVDPPGDFDGSTMLYLSWSA